MNDLLKKLNTLVRANLNTPSLPRFERTPNLERQVRDLRERINVALQYEDELEAKADALRQEMAQLDARADAAMAKGQEAEARHLLQQLQRLEQRLTIAEADLRAHRRAAEGLIQQVNMLDASAADVRAAQAQPVAESDATTATGDDLTGDSALDRISGMLQEAQNRTKARISAINEAMSDVMHDAKRAANNDLTQDEPEPLRNAPPEAQSPAAPRDSASANLSARSQPPAPDARNDDEDDDLAQRLRRLSKPE